MKSLQKLITLKVRRKMRKKMVVPDEKMVLFAASRVISREYGRQGESHIRADRYKNKTLFFRVDESVWASDLWLRRSEIVRFVNSECGGECVEKVKIV